MSRQKVAQTKKGCSALPPRFSLAVASCHTFSPEVQNLEVLPRHKYPEQATAPATLIPIGNLVKPPLALATARAKSKPHPITIPNPSPPVLPVLD